MRKILFTLSFLLLTSAPLGAHKVVSSAWIDGQDIEGEIGLSNGDMALEGTVVEVFNSSNEKIGETKVGKDGLFRFRPTISQEHIFRANLGAGHVAHVNVREDELPGGLRITNKTEAHAQAAPNPTASVVSEDIAQLVAQAVRKEVQPLRKEIASYKEKNDLQTILGGIGYILGLTGIAFYMAARKKNKSDT